MQSEALEHGSLMQLFAATGKKPFQGEVQVVLGETSA
jgi:hypothetical protein